MSRHSLTIVLCLALAPSFAGAEDARKLLIESEARHRTKTQQYSGELSVVTKDGKVRKKSWKSWREGYAGDARLLIRFAAPPEVKGVSFLSIGKPGRNPDQWLYLPSMKRERRIASQDRDASFVGTDFNYEDMEEFDQSRYAVSLKGEEVEGGEPCWLIEARPNEKSGTSLYERRLLWLRKEILFLVREDVYRKDEKEPAKRLLLTALERVDGHWVARKLQMDDLKKGSRTTILLEDVSFDRPQPPGRFTLQNLNREGGED